MTHIMEVPKRALAIVATPPGICEDCSEKKELRPYGKDGAFICFDCAMKDESSAEGQFQKLIDRV